MTTLQILWFALIVVLLTGFAILDGFDFGVGFWHLRAKGDKQRRILLNSIGPFWDGNEVWLLTGGGAIFAAFPPVYATIFSGFYLAMILVILTLIGRAVALEFRSKEESKTWRATWDIIFSVCSTLAAVLFGVALGNVLNGIPLNESGDYTGSFWGLLSPYALIFGVLNLAMYAFHGANFIALKTKDELQKKGSTWAFLSGVIYLIIFIIAVVASALSNDHLMQNYQSFKLLWAIPILGGLSIALSIVLGKKGAEFKAFVASGASILLLMATAAVALFPNMVPAINDPNLSLTVANSASSELTLLVMTILAAVGMPLVLGYTIWSYKKFAGKVDLETGPDHY